MALHHHPNIIVNFLSVFFLSFIYESLAIDNYPIGARESLKFDLPQYTEKKNSTISEKFSRFNRQLDSDVETRFHINANTIIRTGESRSMGAKYVNETILPSNHDCLTRCLETPNCNTAVYEEKTIHTCYMFDCGQPPNFLCKFTQHDSFVSSLLKISQHSYDLSQWGNQAKHEKQLDLQTSQVEVSSAPTFSIQEAVTANLPVVKPKNLTKPEDQCRHYQFKCINSTECIAIYNVCDGIPQCPDGSDESPELKCHEKAAAKEAKTMMQRPVEPPHPTKTPKPKPVQKPPLPASTAAVASQNKHSPQPADTANVQLNKIRYTEKPKSVWPDNRSEKQPSRSDYYQRTDESDGLGSPFVHKHSQFVAANDPHVDGLNRWSNDYDQYPGRPIPLEPQYAPYENTYQRGDDQYLPNPLSPEYETAKSYDSYRREDGPSYWTNQESPPENIYPVEEYPQAAMHTLNKPSNYPDKESLYAQQLERTAAQYPEVKHRLIHKPNEIPPSMQQNRASDIEEYKSRRYPMHRQQPPYMAYEEALEKQLASYPDMKPKPYETSQNDRPIYSNEDIIRASLVNQLPPIEIDHPRHSYQYEKQIENVQEKPRLQPKHSVQIKQKAVAEDKSRIAPVKDDSTKQKPTPTAKSVQRTVLDFKMSVTELYQASKTHSQETNSAVLALVMGLTITFLLFVFLGCRVKTIRKRMSRKGRGLAHDADYLVNGMYL